LEQEWTLRKKSIICFFGISVLSLA
jgi:hypothetical protein